MKTIKKLNYCFSVLFVTILIVVCYNIFFNNQPATPDHASLSLTPFTAREQKDLITEQEQAGQLEVNGPLVASMNAADAQAHVLNLNHGANKTS